VLTLSRHHYNAVGIGLDHHHASPHKGTVEGLRGDRVSDVKKLSEFNELATAMALLRQSVDLAGHKVNAGQQANGAEALIFMIAGEGRVQPDSGGTSGAEPAIA